MVREQKMAIARIFSDLIKADRIVDTGEMKFWKKACSKYDLDRDIQIDSRSLSLAQALNIICESAPLSKDEQQVLLSDCIELTVSDGFCAHSEALLMITLIVMLDPESEFHGEVYSIPRANFNIDIATAIYIENEDDPFTNRAIRNNYRSLFKEFQLAGFHFVYLPKIIEHYRDTAKSLFIDILSFLSPSTSEEGLENSYNSLMDMTTSGFCKDLLCNRCGITELRDTPSSLLIKISNSFVGEEAYANYLRIEVDEDILRTVQDLLDKFCHLLSTDVYVINTSEERDNQFHFHGFYKQLLEIFLIKKNIRSRIVIDTCASRISFPEIDAIARLGMRERALYTLLLCRGNEGFDFSRPVGQASLEKFDIRMETIGKKYARIYEALGGTRQIPDITKDTIRRPLITNIKNNISSLQGLYNPDDYNISSPHKSVYRVDIEPALIYVKESDGEHPLLESRLYRKYIQP